jgi:hypothetical protein
MCCLTLGQGARCDQTRCPAYNERQLSENRNAFSRGTVEGPFKSLAAFDNRSTARQSSRGLSQYGSETHTGLLFRCDVRFALGRYVAMAQLSRSELGADQLIDAFRPNAVLLRVRMVVSG